MLNNSITVELEGGCGNQLFQFFAGLHLAHSTGSPLKADFSNVSGNRHQGYCISESQYLSNLQGVSFFKAPKQNVLKKYLKKSTRKNFRADGIGFPKNFASMAKAKSIAGYFQTDFFIQQLINNQTINLELFQKSLWYSLHAALKKEINYENSTVIHIRGGDYQKQKNTIGMLSNSYYLAANLQLNKPSWTTYIVSDESEESISKRIGDIFPYKYLDTNKLHPLEVIALISKFQNIVISNSTLSWWGAFLQESGSVIAPDKWFSGLESPEMFIPSGWIKVSSAWVP